jgi:hypothetical protein
VTVNWDNISKDITESIIIDNVNKKNPDRNIFDEIKRSIFEPTSWEENSYFGVINDAIIDVWSDDIIDKSQTIYLGYVRKKNPLIQFWVNKGDDSQVAAQYYPERPDIVKTGRELVKCKFLASSANYGSHIYVLIDWDVIDESLYKLDVSFPLSRMRSFGEYDLFKRVNELEKYHQQQSGYDIVPINVFGDVIPNQFKKIWSAYDKNIEIIIVGDSIVGLQASSGKIPSEEAMFLPPDCQYYHWTWGLFKNIVKNKPDYDRIDAVRDGKKTFMLSGDFQEIESGSGSKLDTPNTFGEWSIAANTYQCNNVGASVSFDWDLSKYKNLNIINSFNPDGAKCVIKVGDGSTQYNNKVLVSLNKELWVEANGYEVNQNSNPDNLSDDELSKIGKAIHQRHRRIWMKPVSNELSDVLNIKFMKNDESADTYMYFWGTERWNGYTAIIDNIGRGGRDVTLLNTNVSDIVDRNPDLVILSCPLANEYSGSISVRAWKEYYNRYLFGEGTNQDMKDRSLLNKSENYTKFSLIAIVPHGRSQYFIEDSVNFKEFLTPEGMPQYFKYRMWVDYLKEKGKSYDGFSVINMFDQLLYEGRRNGLTFEKTLYGDSNSITGDRIHLNRAGSALYTKYLSAIFNNF